MATRTILKVLLWGSASPLICASRLAERFDWYRIQADLSRCSTTISAARTDIPEVLIEALVAAEDRRSHLHPGIDVIGMLRAIWAMLSRRSVQGASTIEQQFARVVSGRYERTLMRKIREQLLALAIARHHSKASVSSAYLSVAFFGSEMVGLSALLRIRGYRLESIGREAALGIVARLRYPEPVALSESWQRKIHKRSVYISDRMTRAQARTAPLRAPLHRSESTTCPGIVEQQGVV